MSQSLTLREVEDSDLPTFYEFECDQESIHMAAFTSEDPTNREGFEKHWAMIRQAPSVTIRSIVRENDILGSVLSYEEEGAREVTYWIGRQYWGQGVATEALKAFLESVDTQRPMRARAAKDNVASLRVLEKCGFIVTGEARGFANARGEEIDELELELAIKS